MTGPFVKNKPALQLLPSPASVSWVLQREAWEPADQCLDSSVLCWGGGVGVERELLGTGSHTSCWRSAQMGLDRTARAREDTVACISNQTPTSREGKNSSLRKSIALQSGEGAGLCVSLELQMSLAAPVVTGSAGHLTEGVE